MPRAEPIQAGDLVYIAVWPCCQRFLGETGTVTGFLTDSYRFCVVCHQPFDTDKFARVELAGDWGLAPINRLRRIPPLSELESTQTREELPA